MRRQQQPGQERQGQGVQPPPHRQQQQEPHEKQQQRAAAAAAAAALAMQCGPVVLLERASHNQEWQDAAPLMPRTLAAKPIEHDHEWRN